MSVRGELAHEFNIERDVSIYRLSRRVSVKAVAAAFGLSPSAIYHVLKYRRGFEAWCKEIRFHDDPAFEWVDAKPCSYLPAGERETIWIANRGEIPDGQRVGWTCEVAYCGKLEHMVLVEDKNSKRHSWAKYHEELRSLEVGEGKYIVISGDDDDFRRLRCALHQAAGKIRFSLAREGKSSAYLKRLEDFSLSA